MTELFRELVKWRVRIQLGVQLPLRACVRNLEASALGIALGIAACCGDHHSQIASLIEGVAHSFLQEGGLQATPPQFWNGRRASEQRNFVMDAQYTGSASFAVNLGKKARTLVASGEDGERPTDAPSAVADGLRNRIVVRLFRRHCWAAKALLVNLS